MLLHHTAYPHILDNVIRHADAETLLNVRQTSRDVRSRVDRRLYRHVLVYPRSTNGREDIEHESRSGYIVSTVANDEGLGEAILPASGLSFTSIVDWLGCDGALPPGLQPRIVRRFGQGLQPLLSQNPRSDIYVDFISNDGIEDDMYKKLTTPPAVRLSDEYDIRQLTVVICPKVGNTPRTWAYGFLRSADIIGQDLVQDGASQWGKIIKEGGTVTIVGMERVGKLVATIRHREVNSADPTDEAKSYACDLVNEVLDIARTSQNACQERIHFKTYEEWITIVPPHLYEWPEFPAAVEDLVLNEIKEWS